jgi:NitT/TauT family transport system ATP-binding protein
VSHLQPYELREVILHAENVSLRFGDKLILRDVNAMIRNVTRPGVLQGQVKAFLGPSGVGKTQLSKVLAGLQPPTTGVVLIGNPQEPVRSGKVGYVTQNYLLRRNRTLLGNLLLAAQMAGMKKAEAKDKVAQYVDMFELNTLVKQYPAQLSGGQRQRVAIAQQLLCSDHYVIMDEPFSGLDPVMKDKVCNLLVKVSLLDELNTLVIVSHDIKSVLKVSDSAWLLGRDRDVDGRLIQGAYIKKEYDLMSAGLCWDPAVAESDEFNCLVKEIEAEFRNL